MLDADWQTGLASPSQAVAERARSDSPPLHFYRALFGHTVRGPIPPYETEYGNEALFQQPQEMGDLMGFYQAFGLTVRVGSTNAAITSAVNANFFLFLLSKKPMPWTIKTQRCWRKHARQRDCFYETILAVSSRHLPRS